MLILGLSAFEHDPAAALFSDGTPLAAIEERKLTRLPARGLPQAAIRYCLGKAGVDWRGVDLIASATRPWSGWISKSSFRLRRAVLAPIAGAYSSTRELGVLLRELSNSRRLAEVSGVHRSKVLSLDHHDCHAASAFYASSFDRALIITMDEEGDGCSCAVALGVGSEIHALRRIPFPHSLGWVYSQVTALLGFRPHQDEHKVQWVSLEGEPVHRGVFLDMLRRPPDPHPHLNFKYFNRGLSGAVAFSTHFYRKVGLTPGEVPSQDQAKALATSLQQACAQLVSDLIEFYCKREQVENVCLAGGLFQNTLLISDIEKKVGARVFVPVAPGNAGCALGAGYLAWHRVLGKPRSESTPSVYLGPKYTRQEIKDVLDNCKCTYSILDTELRILDAAVQLFQAGKIVAWYQGATEFGSRALGNRSLLASPWAPYVRENLNDFVKHREWFRPFALAVPEEDCRQWFECSMLSQLMSSLGWARPAVDGALRDFLMPENRVRLQVVQREANPLFWRLLKRFGEQGPAPILVNTSFNLFGEPLVVSPRDAVRSFYSSGVDALMMDNFLLRKHLEIPPALREADARLPGDVANLRQKPGSPSAQQAMGARGIRPAG
jgi:carbamoyltransferase